MMRLLPPLVCLAYLAGCQALDVSQPIALVVGDDWPPLKANAVAAAADCWNIRFGTQIGVQVRANHTQQVVVDFETAVCPFAEAGTTLWPPRGVYVCPGQYLQRNPSLTRLFAILLHELGHVLNIPAHAPDGTDSVMGVGRRSLSGKTSPPARFTDNDAEMFYEANPDFDAPPPCEVVGIPRTFDGDGGCSCGQ